MANMLTWLFQLLFLPCTLAIANVRKFLHMASHNLGHNVMHSALSLKKTRLDIICHDGVLVHNPEVMGIM